MLSGAAPLAIPEVHAGAIELWPVALVGLCVAGFFYVRGRLRAVDARERLQQEAMQHTMRQAWHEAAPRWAEAGALFAVEATRTTRHPTMDRIDPRMSPLVRGAIDCFALAGLAYAELQHSVDEAAAWREWNYWQTGTRDAERLSANDIRLSRATMYEAAGDTLARWAAPLAINERTRLQAASNRAYQRAQTIYKTSGRLADFGRVRGKRTTH